MNFVIRSARNPFRSRPSLALTLTTISFVLFGTALPFTSIGALMKSLPSPWIPALHRGCDRHLSVSRGSREAQAYAKTFAVTWVELLSGRAKIRNLIRATIRKRSLGAFQLMAVRHDRCSISE